MKTVVEIINRDGFLKTLFESIPCGVLVVDSDRRVQAVNDTLERTFGIATAEVINLRGGEALNCIHASKSTEGCGYAEFCSECMVRNSALKAIDGEQVRRTRAEIQLKVDGEVKDLILLVSAAPVDFKGERLAIVMLEDISELNQLRTWKRAEHGFSGIVGRDPRMLELYETIVEVAEVNDPVMIQGESGTGKELVANAIHQKSERAKMPFVPVNCGALPEGMVESELFGHVKGAFTGAIRDKKGRFELAHGGTLFLDEVAELSEAMQVKLLRVLQEGTFERIGGEQTISVDVRLISATNKELKKEVKKGRFREDLFYRVNVFPIQLPPLRRRKNDIPILTDHFLDKAMKEGMVVRGFSEDAINIMINYPWPGNIRELQSAVRYSLVKARGQLIRPEGLPQEIKSWHSEQPTRGPARKLDEENVRAALVQSGGNKAKAARLLGVGRATLYRFLSDFPDVSNVS